MRSRGGMALASTPLSRHGNPGSMTNAREATKLAQQLATDLQVAGTQCVEALVEWMLEAGAQAETPPPFLWRGRNYFLKMVNDLDFAETELQVRGVNLDCFKQRNPLLIRPNQKLGRVLAAHSIIMEMVEFAKDMTPMELLALSGRMRDSNREEGEVDEATDNSQTKSSGSLGGSDDNHDYSRIQSGGVNLTNKQKLEHHDHESAAELVNLLDESLDFIPSSASRGDNGNQGDPSYVNNSDGNGDANYLDSGCEGRSLFRNSASVNDGKSDNVEPKDGAESSADAPEFHEEQGTEDDNQSEYDDNSMDGNDHNIPEEGEPQMLFKTTDVTDAGCEAESVNSNTMMDNLELEAGELDAVNNDGNLIPVLKKQSSARSKTSDNQSEYENSFDAEGGDACVEPASGESNDDTQPEDVAGEDESTGSDDPATPDENEDDKVEKKEDSFAIKDSSVESPPSPEKLSSRTEENNPSEYENSFDEEAGDDKPNVELDTDALTPTAVSTLDEDAREVISNVPSTTGVQEDKHLVELENNDPVSEVDDPQMLSKRLVDELKRWTFLEDENRPTEVNARACLAWCDSRVLTDTLQNHSSISECIEGSIISVLEQYGLAVSESPLESLLCSELAQELDLAGHLMDECHAVVGDICSVVSKAMQHAIQLKHSLVSEMEISEVFEVTESVRQEYHETTWEYLKIASTLLIFLYTSKNPAFVAQTKTRSAVSSGLSRLVKVFYPYLVNYPREELGDNWSPVSSVLAAMKLPVNQLYSLLDPMCKTLLLAVQLCNHSNQDSQDENDFAIFPKVTIICNREDVLQSSVGYVWRHYLSSESVTPNFLLFPFFESSFGEKLVDGVKVEEGEGKGPLKEWFGLVGNQLASKWKQIPARTLLADASSTEISASNNTITIPGAAEAVCPGFKLEWDTSDGETFCRVVNKVVGDDTFLLDRGVPTHSISTYQLRILKPNAAVFEYVQGSESYWLNENTCDSPEMRNVLTFVGWFFASAMTHFCSIRLRIHPLFFGLLLDSQHCVSLEEIQRFDPELFKSLSGMKDMKPSDFTEYLRFEGADENLSVEAYIAKVLEEKFGQTSGIGWQMDCVRRGFTRVLAVDQLSRVGITEGDLVESICGSVGGGSDDFIINEVFRVAADSDFTGCQPLVKAFWQTVNSFAPPLKRKFIKFVTGVDTLPLAGTETCDNTLELPHYWKALCWKANPNELEGNDQLEEELALLLDKKLRDAVEYSSGYGLDGTSAVAGVFDKTDDDDEEAAKEESYDSLGLPALSEGQAEADQPNESSQPSPRPSDHDEVEGQEDEAAPADPEATTEPPAAARSPRPDESYDDYDWEEEEQSVS
ncbi:unnamed protein product [Phytophthora fragariaefolia]|uniref:HECT-type E3 ubiquitin transferase n=1 Tax=Phytophthora fragariaefolia TaxID=1490495 RepID=A0A9W7CQ63_9STRA|nr:unnamed protein product [Phytophthora fragariaefolia]